MVARQTPWWRSGVVYQVYPRSFADSNGDGVGDLAGVTSRLDHLVDLGVDVVWLSPFYRSPMADFGYDVSDYTDVDPTFGALADADALLEGAHARGLRVVFDWVPNHTSDQHEWFLASRSSRADPKRSWYVWRDPEPGGGPPNNWISAFSLHGKRPSWTLDEQTGQFYLHSFLPEQPDLNWEHPAVAEVMREVLRFWLDRGVDGFRIDVAHALGKDPALGDNEPGRRHDQDWPNVHPRLRAIRRVLEEYEGDRMAVGEVYLLDQAELAPYVRTGDELHLAHNFAFLNLPWSAAGFRAMVDEFEQLAGPGAWPAWCLGNHDHSRIASRYGTGPARVAAMLLLTLRGTPFLFHGDELGLTDVEIPRDRVVDVDGRDPERSPVPWEPPSSAGPGAGFTTGEPWLPITPDAEKVAASVQAGDPESMLALYCELLALRRTTPALSGGSYRALEAGEGIYAYQRGGDVAVALNFAPEPRPVRANGRGSLLASTRPAGPRGTEVDLATLVLEADEGVIVALG
ncbi:MAG: alpha-amylase family glycosyl hydrolase [Thermoleophilaceae bacterium]